MFICGMVLRCAGILNIDLMDKKIKADLKITVAHSYTLLVNDVKPLPFTLSLKETHCGHEYENRVNIYRLYDNIYFIEVRVLREYPN